ncbi:lipopolysaccharide biosynthesis protein [Aureibaculum conchae]|uniref:lipopolysaccharide biosynthesis protein n=1 Tax=Aureibaculum sp. 2308TA14-22 TaxID=3108392 RepID=UPI003391174F
MNWKPFNIIKSFFKGHERTVKAKKNIIASAFIKGLSMIVGFLMIRITLDYLDKTNYGIFLTLTSFLAWFSFFEVGLGNGLKNKLAEALAVKDYKLGKIYVSTTYAILALITSFIAVIFFISNFYIDWTVILNTDKKLFTELTSLTFIIFGFFFLKFVMQLISVVLFADQRPALGNIFGPIGNLIALILIYILTKTTEGSLVYLGWVISVVPVIVLLVATIYFYNNDYKHIAPSFSHVKMEYAKDLLNLGVKFFFIQIIGLIVYQSSNFIIAQYLGPAEVTVYNIGYKYFSILMMAFNIIVAPFWAAYTEAWVKKDMVWIKNTVKKLLMIWGGLAIGGILMVFFADPFYHILSKGKVEVPLKLSIALLIYFITFNFGGIFVMFINGVGKIKLQMYSSAIGALVFIAVAIILVKYYKIGMIGLVVASILSNFYGLILAPIQYRKLINNSATGIWGK